MTLIGAYDRTMRRTALGFVLILATLAAPTQARADGLFSLHSFFLDARAHVFLDSDVREGAGFPTGIDAEVQFDVVHNLELYATTGFLYGVAGDITNFYIPFVGGAVYLFSEGSKTPFVGAGLGALIAHLDDDTNFKGTLEVHGGYQTSSFRLKLGLQFFDNAELSESATVFASLGFDLM